MRNKQKLYSIQFKLMIIMVSLAITVIIATTSVTIYHDINRLTKQLEQEAHIVSRVMAQDFARLSLMDSTELAADIVSKLTEFPMVSEIDVNNNAGKSVIRFRRRDYMPLSDTVKKSIFFLNELFIETPITYQTRVLGTAYYTISTQEIHDSLASVYQLLAWTIPGCVLFSVLAAFFLQRLFTRPLIQLTNEVEHITQNQDYDFRLDVHSEDKSEIGRLRKSFNGMLTQIQQSTNIIKDSQQQLENYNLTLEEKVRQRTEELLQSEKMAALGQLIASIAHEINTPLGAINSSTGSMQKFLTQTLTQMPSLFQSFSKQECDEFLFLLNKSLENSDSILSTREQRQKRRTLTHQLGDEIEDVDSVADTLVDMRIYDDIDEIMPLLKRPNNGKILDLAYKLSELNRGTQTICMATDRAAKVVFALKSYVHQDASEELIKTDISEGIETVLTLYHGKMKHGVEVIRNYQANLPKIDCYPDELNQVWTNLIHNALQAMDNQGIIEVTVQRQDEMLKINIQDDGKGIKPENLTKIFDAFYTTKRAGEGSGLGLHIIKKIIEKHSGTISVNSKPGCTVFSVSLPIDQAKSEENL